MHSTKNWMISIVDSYAVYSNSLLSIILLSLSYKNNCSFDKLLASCILIPRYYNRFIPWKRAGNYVSKLIKKSKRRKITRPRRKNFKKSNKNRIEKVKEKEKGPRNSKKMYRLIHSRIQRTMTGRPVKAKIKTNRTQLKK